MFLKEINKGINIQEERKKGRKEGRAVRESKKERSVTERPVTFLSKKERKKERKKSRSAERKIERKMYTRRAERRTCLSKVCHSTVQEKRKKDIDAYKGPTGNFKTKFYK